MKNKNHKKKYNIKKIFVIKLNRRKDRLNHFESKYNFNIKFLPIYLENSIDTGATL